MDNPCRSSQVTDPFPCAVTSTMMRWRVTVSKSWPGKKKIKLYSECWMSWTDAAYGNTNKSALWLMVWNLALYLYHRTYVLLKILMSKMIYYYYFICRSKMQWRKKRIFSWSYPHVEFCSKLQNDGLGKDDCFSVSEVLKNQLRPMIYR